MEDKLILYKKSDDNSIAMIIPAPSSELSIEEIAKKDTPAGLPYVIVDRSSVPLEHLDYFDAWEADFSNPDGYGIGHKAWFAEQEAKKQEVGADDNNQP